MWPLNRSLARARPFVCTEGASAGRDTAACPSGDAGARVKRTRRQGQQATPLESASRRRGRGNGDSHSVFSKAASRFLPCPGHLWPDAL